MAVTAHEQPEGQAGPGGAHSPRWARRPRGSHGSGWRGGRSPAEPGKSPAGFPGPARGLARLRGPPAAPGPALPGTAVPRPAPTLLVSRRDWRCFSAAPSARSRCCSAARRACLAARTAAMPPRCPAGSMCRGKAGRGAGLALPGRAPGDGPIRGRAPSRCREAWALPSPLGLLRGLEGQPGPHQLPGKDHLYF